MTRRRHAQADCPRDESCVGCWDCYLQTGDTRCDGCCDHSADNYPDDEEDAEEGEV